MSFDAFDQILRAMEGPGEAMWDTHLPGDRQVGENPAFSGLFAPEGRTRKEHEVSNPPLPDGAEGGSPGGYRGTEPRAPGAKHRSGLSALPGLGAHAPALVDVLEGVAGAEHSAAQLRRMHRDSPRPRRRSLWSLRDSLRPFQGPPRPDKKGRLQVPRPTKCGHTLCGVAVGDGTRLHHVEVRLSGNGASFAGLVRCGSIWACPVCGGALRAAKAAEVEKLVAWHGSDRAALGSFTVKHALGNDLKETARGMARAWSRVINGTPWKKYAARWGIEGMVRALEVTHGEHGWHPHLHVVFLLSEAGPKERWQNEKRREKLVMIAGKPAWRKSVLPGHVRAWKWLAKRWREAVILEIGAHAEPDVLQDGTRLSYDNREHRRIAVGTDVRPLHSASYIAKLGLEVSDPFLKKARKKGSRTPMEIAVDLTTRTGTDTEAKQLRARDAALWLAYVQGTRGRQALAWSKGLKARAGIIEVEDEALVLAEESEAGEAIATIAPGTWQELRRCKGATCELLEHVEKTEAPAVWAEPWALAMPTWHSERVEGWHPPLEEWRRVEPYQAPQAGLRGDQVVAEWVDGRLAEQRWREEHLWAGHVRATCQTVASGASHQSAAN